jgi:hypothetical protein
MCGSFQPTEDAIRKWAHKMIRDDSIRVDILSLFTCTINDQVTEFWLAEGSRTVLRRRNLSTFSY